MNLRDAVIGYRKRRVPSVAKRKIRMKSRKEHEDGILQQQKLRGVPQDNLI